jgi:hypothetical protein
VKNLLSKWYVRLGLIVGALAAMAPGGGKRLHP